MHCFSYLLSFRDRSFRTYITILHAYCQCFAVISVLISKRGICAPAHVPIVFIHRTRCRWQRLIKLFCSCGSMMFPKDGQYVCNKCGETKTIEVSSSQHFTTNANNKETTVIAETSATLPKTKILCESCGNGEAYFVIRQTRAADEPETRIYRCCKCNYSWREY